MTRKYIPLLANDPSFTTFKDSAGKLQEYMRGRTWDAENAPIRDTIHKLQAAADARANELLEPRILELPAKPSDAFMIRMRDFTQAIDADARRTDGGPWEGHLTGRTYISLMDGSVWWEYADEYNTLCGWITPDHEGGGGYAFAAQETPSDIDGWELV